MGKSSFLRLLHPVLQRVAYFATLFGVWLACFPHTLIHFEETDYWIDAPDMTSTIYQWPQDWAAIGSCYLLQFFQNPVCGAVILCLSVLLVLLATDVILWRLARNRQLLWISFVPATFLAVMQTGNMTLEPALKGIVIFLALAFFAAIVSLCKAPLRVKSERFWLRIGNALLPWLCIVVTVGSLTLNPDRQHAEQTNRIEHLAAGNTNHKWLDLLDITYPLRYELDDNQMSYSLLALSCEGLLPERLFTYPVRGLENIFTHSQNYRFNAYFCHELGLPNEAIRYTFEEGQYMPAGASFGSIRRMVDWLLEKGDDPQLADYYLNLLGHTSCHHDFITTRRIFMNQTPLEKKQTHEPEFVGTPSFLHEAAVVLDRDPTNKRARDYLLCGMLLLGNTEGFYKLFEQIYVQMDNERIPRYYMEALVMLLPQHPGIAMSYIIPDNMRRAYATFCQLARQGKKGKQEAAAKYKETYWAYLLRQSETRRPAVESVTGASLTIGKEFGN